MPRYLSRMILQHLTFLFTKCMQTQKPSLTGKRPQPKSALPIAIKIKSQSKKARIESPPTLTEKELNDSTAENAGERNCLGLVAYSDESGDE